LQERREGHSPIFDAPEESQIKGLDFSLLMKKRAEIEQEKIEKTEDLSEDSFDLSISNIKPKSQKGIVLKR
jgi:hypothetical protein